MSVLTPAVIANETMLRRLAAGDVASKSALAAALERDLSNLGKALKALEGEGIVAGLALTVAGRRAIEAMDVATGRSPAPAAGVAEIPLDRIDRDPTLNPRTVFDDEPLQDLAASIKDKGVAQPILLRQGVNPLEGRYRIVAGERRFRASQLAGLTTIPAVIRELDDDQALEIALIENIQRVDLSPIEEARAFKRIIEAKQAHDSRLSQRAAAGAIVEATRKSLRYIEQRLQLLKLPKADQDRMALPADNPRHLSVTEARHAMQSHDRADAEAMEVTLGPDQLLLLGEIAAFIAGDGKLKTTTKSVGGGARDDEPALKKLSRAGLIFAYKNYNDGFEQVQLTDKGLRCARLRIPKFENDRELALREFRKANLPAAAIDALDESGKRFLTSWLNEPIELHPAEAAARKAQAEREETNRQARADRDAREAKVAADYGAKGKAFLLDVRALEADLVASGTQDVADRLSALLARHGYAGPFTVALSAAGYNQLPALVDANGEAMVLAGGALEAFRRVTALAVNIVLGLSPATGPGLGDKWERSIGLDQADEADDADPHTECDLCGEQHPVNVLDDGCCPHCIDKEADGEPVEAPAEAVEDAELTPALRRLAGGVVAVGMDGSK